MPEVRALLGTAGETQAQALSQVQAAELGPGGGSGETRPACQAKGGGMTEDPKSPTVARTPVAGCSACEHQTMHTEADWLNHPFKGHGFQKEVGWSHPQLLKEAIR